MQRLRIKHRAIFPRILCYNNPPPKIKKLQTVSHSSYRSHYSSFQDTQSVTQHLDDIGPRARRGPIISRVQHQVNRAKGEQEKWKGTVQEQRRNVYDRHTMLNWFQSISIVGGMHSQHLSYLVLPKWHDEIKFIILCLNFKIFYGTTI